MNARKLECSVIVLRALIRASHIDKTAKEVLTGAFLLRTFEGGEHEKGLSVAHGCTPKKAAEEFKKCYGVASLHVGRVRSLGLDVVADDPQAPDYDPNHANIVNLPHPEDDPAEAEHFASELQKQCRLVWEPPPIAS